MIELTLVGSFIIGVVVFIIMRRKENVTYSGTVTLESIKEVARLITHESFISDFVTLYNTKGKKIALLHIDAKVQITFDLKKMKFREGTSIIEFFPEPNVVAIENIFSSKENDENYEQTEFILLEKAIYISRTNLEKVEKAFFEDYKKIPSVITEIYKAKRNFLLDINSFAQAMGADFKIEFSENLMDKNRIIENELKSITEGSSKMNSFTYVILDSDIEESKEAEIEFVRLAVFIGLIKIDSNIHPSEDEFIKTLIDNAVLLDIDRNKLLDMLLNETWYEQIGKGVVTSLNYLGKHANTGLSYLIKNITNLKPNTPIEEKCDDIIRDKTTGIEYFVTFLNSNPLLNIDLLKQDHDMANEIINKLFIIANLDKNIVPEELGYISGVGEFLEVKSELIDEYIKKYCDFISSKV